MKYLLYLMLTSNAAVTVAQGTEPASGGGGGNLDFITPFLNVGLVGVLLLMFVLRKGIVPEWVLKQAEERHKEELAAKDADIKELKQMVKEGTDLYNTQVVPAFTRSIDVNREYLELLRDQQVPPKRQPRSRGE